MKMNTTASSLRESRSVGGGEGQILVSGVVFFPSAPSSFVVGKSHVHVSANAPFSQPKRETGDGNESKRKAKRGLW